MALNVLTSFRSTLSSIFKLCEVAVLVVILVLVTLRLHLSFALPSVCLATSHSSEKLPLRIFVSQLTIIFGYFNCSKNLGFTYNIYDTKINQPRSNLIHYPLNYRGANKMRHNFKCAHRSNI